MKSIKRNLAYNIILNISTVVFPLITAPYVARVLDPDGVGLYNFANTYAGYFAVVALLGIPTYGVREVSKSRDDIDKLSHLLSQLMTIAFITSLIVGLAYVLTIAFISKLSENYILFLIAGFAIYLAPLKINWFYQGIEEFGFITFRSLVIKTLSVACLFIFVREKSDLVIYIIISVASNVIGDLWNFIKMWKSGVRPSLTLGGLKQHIKPLLILFSSSIATTVYTVLGTLMLGFLRDYNEVGYFTAVGQITGTLVSGVTSLSVVAVPRVSYYLNNKDFDSISELLNKSLSFVAFLAIPMAIGLMCLSATFVPLFFGENFYGGIIPLRILSFLLIAIGLNNLTGIQALIGMGLDKFFLYSVSIGAIANFMLNCFLIPLMGATGASISSLFSETLILFITTYFVYKYTPIRIHKIKDIAKSLCGAIILIPLFYLEGLFFEGWLLVLIFVVTGGSVYILFEAAVNYSTLRIKFETVLRRKNEKNC